MKPRAVLAFVVSAAVWNFLIAAGVLVVGLWPTVALATAGDTVLFLLLSRA